MSADIAIDPAFAALAERFSDYLETHMPEVQTADVESIERIHGGASRETFRVRVHLRKDAAMPGETRGLILRRDPTGSLIDTEREVEFNAYRAFHGTSVPVPEALFLETDPKWLDRPFFVMSEIEAGTAASPFAADPYGGLAGVVGEQFWTHLGAIAAADPRANGLAESMEMPAPETCWERELAYWEGVIDADELEPHPIARAAIRKLRRHPPPPAQKVGVVHGDYRTGNFLYDETGRITAILDWEMCHLGDPLEDLAWALDPLWAAAGPELPGSLIPRDEAIALWEKASGLKADPQALSWWQLFSHVKGLGIWISSSHEYATGSNKDPVLAFSGLYCTARHNAIVAERLLADFEAAHGAEEPAKGGAGS